MKRFLLLLAVCVSVVRTRSLIAAEKSSERITYEEHVLPNGLVVLFHEDHYAPLVAINIWYKVGAKNEEKGKTGFAHLFEHYMFEGSAHSPNGQFDQHTEGVGGYNNANTTEDRTDFYETVPSDYFKEVLRMESDRMGFFDSTIDQRHLDKQRGIVKNEKRQDENQPYGKLEDTLSDRIWGLGHPYKAGVIGSMADLDHASVDDVRRFHSTYYVPNNAVMSIVGDFDSQETLKSVERLFGSIPAGPPPPAVVVPPAGSANIPDPKTMIDEKAQFPLLLMAYRIPGFTKPHWEDFDVLTSLLCQGRTSRLEKALHYDRQLVVQISCGVNGLQEDDLVEITAIPRPGVKLKEVESAINSEIARVIQDGFTPHEMNRVKAGLETAKFDMLQNVDAVASALVQGQAVFGDPDYALDTQINQIKQMDIKAPQQAAASFLKPEKAVVIYVLPKAGEQQ